MDYSFQKGLTLDSISSKLFQSNVSWIAPLEHLTYPKFKPILKACSALGFECAFKSTRRGREISIFHQLLLNLVALRYGGKEEAKNQLGGINDPSKSSLLTFIKKLLLSIEPIWYLKKQLTFVIKVGESKDGFWWWHEPKCVQNFSLKTCIAPSKHYFFQPPILS